MCKTFVRRWWVFGLAIVAVVAGLAAAAAMRTDPWTAAAAAKEQATSAAPATGVDIAREATDLPQPIGDRPAQRVRFDIETSEVEGQLADGTTYTYLTFDGKVPGPFLRVRVGDTVEVHLSNAASSKLAHSIDLHAVAGPGGGAEATQVKPGEEKSFTFKALKAGLYVYHCATPMVAHHIAGGMFGLILVEPEGGLPAVDREFYVMQSEVYTTGGFGAKGHQSIDMQKLVSEEPDYFVFNGSVDALKTAHPLKAKTGETVRIYFGVGGPNFVSSFHVIGGIFDRVYELGSLTSAPLGDVQTVLVPPGGATVVDITFPVPGKFMLVDHALSRAQRGLLGVILVEGPENPDIFHTDSPAAAGGGMEH